MPPALRTAVRRLAAAVVFGTAHGVPADLPAPAVADVVRSARLPAPPGAVRRSGRMSGAGARDTLYTLHILDILHPLHILDILHPLQTLHARYTRYTRWSRHTPHAPHAPDTPSPPHTSSWLPSHSPPPSRQ